VAVLGLFYRPALDDWFFHDDFVFLERSTLSGPGDLLASFSVERNRQGLLDKQHSYRPISTNLYFGLVQAGFGADARVFHAINLLTLAGIATLVVLLLTRLGLGLPGGLALAAIFATSSVSHATQLWISVFQELSFSFLALVAVLIHVRPGPSTPARSAAVLGLFAAALLCKEMAISLPALLLCWDLVVRRARPFDAVRATLPLWLVAGAYVVVRTLVFSIPSSGPYAVKLGAFLLESAVTYVDWAARALFLTADRRIEAVLLVAAALAFWAASPDARRRALFGLLWFAIALGPVIFLPNHVYRFYLFFPTVGLVIAIAALVEAPASRIPWRPLRAGLAFAPALIFILLSHQVLQGPAALRQRQVDLGHAIVAQLRALHPELPDGTRVYLSAAGDLPLTPFLKDSGAALRVAYGNPTLRAAPLTRRVVQRIGIQPEGPVLAFHLDAGGKLKPNPRNPRLLWPASTAADRALDDRPDIVLVLVDTWRWDALGANGSAREDITPNLDALAAAGVLFTRAYAASPWTLPSVATTLTGRYPTVHGAFGRYLEVDAIRPDVPLLAERLLAAGYHTAAVINAPFLHRRFGFDRGFVIYDYHPAQNVRLRRAGPSVDAALRHWRSSPADRPIFLLLHVFDPHLAYDPPAPWDRRWTGDYTGPLRPPLNPLKAMRSGEFDPSPEDRAYLRALYDGEVGYTDQELGRFLDGLDRAGRDRERLVLVTSDHGEEFGEHGGWEHGHAMYDELVRLPLIVAPPTSWQVEPGRVDAQVRALDVVPTLLEAAAVPVSEDLPGRSLRALMTRGRGEDRPAFSEREHLGEATASLRAEGWSLIVYPERDTAELYARDDAGERNDRAAVDPERVSRMRALLDSVQGRLAAAAAEQGEAPPGPELDPELLRQLRALGYVSP
jgi:arylsulfatase A-like enzyme